MIVPDPAVSATRNVATTLAGLRDALVAPAEMAARFGLPVLEDLRGRFTDAHAAYMWAVERLWPLCTHRMLVGLDPEKNLENLRDYAVANRAFVLWADPVNPDEAALAASLMRQMPPNSPYLGWWPNDHENAGTELASRHSMYVLATDYITNLTVLAGTRHQPTPARPAPEPRLQRRIYVTFTVTDGDNLQYNQHHMRRIWDTPGRGRTPLNWTISPLTLDAAPVILSYYQRTATPNDLLVAGPSGLGYTYPSAWPPDSLTGFTRQTGTYLHRAGLPAVCVLNRSGNTDIDLTSRTVAAYTRDAHPLGMWQHFTDHFGTSVIDGTPISTGRLVSTPDEARQALAAAAQNWDPATPLFLTIGVLAWNLTPADVNDIAQGLDKRFTVVRGDHFFRLIRQSHASTASS